MSKRRPFFQKRVTAALVFAAGVTALLLLVTALALAFVFVPVQDRPVVLGVLLGAFAIVLLFGALCARAAAKRLSLPLSLTDDQGKGRVYAELLPLFERLERQDAAIEKQLTAARRRQEEFRVLSENMDEGLVIADRHGKIVSANATARAFMEAEEDGGAVADILRIAQSGRHNESTAFHEGRHYRLIGSPVVYNERIVGAVALLLDETEKRSMEQYRKEFTANVSHELKTPLTSISGFAELLVNGMVAPEDIPEFAADIYAEARRLLTLVNDIIRLSRLEDGSRPYENTEVDLYATAAAALSHVRPAAERQGITLILDGTHETVRGAEPILYDVVYNLCDNAVKYNRAGGEVRVYVGEGETGVILSVEDSGIGIPSEHLDRIFERFYRVDKSHSKEIGGTGLGLSIVRHGVAYHGGQVSLSSEVGTGTKVTVTLKKEQNDA